MQPMTSFLKKDLEVSFPYNLILDNLKQKIIVFQVDIELAQKKKKKNWISKLCSFTRLAHNLGIGS